MPRRTRTVQAPAAQSKRRRDQDNRTLFKKGAFPLNKLAVYLRFAREELRAAREHRALRAHQYRR